MDVFSIMCYYEAVLSNLLRLIGEWGWWSRGGILSERWGARSMREVCESCLAGESLAPYKTKKYYFKAVNAKRMV